MNGSESNTLFILLVVLVPAYTMVIGLLAWEVYWLRRLHKIMFDIWADIKANTENFKKLMEMLERVNDAIDKFTKPRAPKGDS